VSFTIESHSVGLYGTQTVSTDRKESNNEGPKKANGRHNRACDSCYYLGALSG
jgi:hypothetical protein